MLHQSLGGTEVLNVQIIPSPLIITLELATATNILFPKVTLFQLPEGELLGVQVIPSGLVIITLLSEIPTNKPFP